MMHPYVQAYQAYLEPHANAETAIPMQKYMRDQFPFLGIKQPAHLKLRREFIREHGLPPLEQIEEITRGLWALPQREFQYAALAFLDKLQKRLTPDHVPLIEALIVTKSWWDTVDSIAIHNVGKLLATYPALRDPTIHNWRQSDNIWLRRTTLLFQLDYKDRTNEALLFELIQANAQSEEFFLRKAIGWALREYSKTQPEAVKQFVVAAPLAALSRREALKWMKARGM